MAELVALTSRHLRATLRGRATRAGAVLFVLALAATLLLPDASGGGLLLLAGLLVLTFFVSGFAVGAGAALPEDRVAGREAWLASLAPPGWKRRLAVVLAAWSLAVVMGVLGGLAVGGLALIARGDLALDTHEPIALPERALLAPGAAPTAVALPPGGAGRTLEIDVKPLYRLQRAPPDRVRIAWSAAGQRGTLEASARGPLRLVPPAGANSIELALETQRIRLRLAEARRLEPAGSPLVAIVWTGLLLGLLAGAVAPIAVLVSRATTGQTASAAAFLLLLFGATKHGLIGMAADLHIGGWLAFAPDLLRTVAWIAPEAPLLHLVAEAGALRAPGVAAAGLVLPALLYTAITAVPACVPAPAALSRGVNA
ncbi:MAG: hypothetical protein QNJ90_00595 [Planctomycetota bacterium]|nr:hypothetical protein [Planctomycetota bacterium]